MKKVLLMAFIGGLLFTGNVANAQFRMSVNIGAQPAWGPTGYDYAQYYYMPDIDAYYDVAAGQYVYFNGGRWVFAAALPGAYHYDLYRGYKVVVNEPRPWMHADIYRNRYAQYRGWYGRQEVIRDSRDTRYAAARGRDWDHRGGDWNNGRGNWNNNRGGNWNNNRGGNWDHRGGENRDNRGGGNWDHGRDNGHFDHHDDHGRH
jgi:hypothetical protein